MALKHDSTNDIIVTTIAAVKAIAPAATQNTHAHRKLWREQNRGDRHEMRFLVGLRTLSDRFDKTYPKPSFARPPATWNRTAHITHCATQGYTSRLACQIAQKRVWRCFQLSNTKSHTPPPHVYLNCSRCSTSTEAEQAEGAISSNAELTFLRISLKKCSWFDQGGVAMAPLLSGMQ